MTITKSTRTENIKVEKSKRILCLLRFFKDILIILNVYLVYIYSHAFWLFHQNNSSEHSHTTVFNRVESNTKHIHEWLN